MMYRSSMSVLVALAFTCSSAASFDHFRIMEGAQDRCPTGFEITSAEECRDAIQALGLESQMITYASEGVIAPYVYAWTMNSWPVGCSHPHQEGNPSFGVFNSDKAGKGDDSVSLICRISEWTPLAGAASSVWIGEYEVLEGSEGCPAEAEITSAAECETALLSLDLKSDDVVEGQHSYRPSGCSYLSNGDGGFFNTWELAKAVEDFDPICRKVNSVAELPVSKIGFESAMELWDDLEADDVDIGRIFIQDAGSNNELNAL